MVKRAFLLACLLFALPALAAPETTTINGTIYVGGVPATAGSVSATLNQAGVTPDGAADVAVTGTTTTGLSGTGTFTIVLVPNDAIRPSGTYYDVRITTTAPTSSSWRERWVVSTSPDPTTYGAVTKVDVVPGKVVHADFVRYVPIEPSGTCTANETPRIALATDKFCECLSGLWSCATMAGGTGHTIKDEGTPLTQRAGLNFTGAGVQCVDDGGGNQTTCDVTGGGGGTPGGSTTQVQFNDAGAFGGDAGLTYDKATDNLVCDGTVDAKILRAVGYDIPSQVLVVGEHYNNSTRPIVALIRGRGTVAVPTDVQDQDILGDWQAQGLHGGANRASANIRMKVAAPWATNDYPAKIEFDLTGPGESARSTRMTLDAAGLTLPGAVTAGSLVGPLTGTASGNLVTADINTFSELDAIVADKALVNKADGAVWTGAHDYGGASLEIPNSTSLPGTCVVGQLYMDTDATSGQRIYACQATNTWVLQGDGGGGGSGDVTGVGDCTGGDCLDGTSDGGTTITLYNAGGNAALLAGAATLDISTPVTATSFTADDPGDGSRGVDLIDNSTACPDPASGSTSVCTIGGRVYRRDTGGSSLLQLEAADIDTSAELATILGDEVGTSGGFTRSSATLLRNANTVTVCASGCNYSTFQGALDGTTATASAPVTILGMPGTYSECLVLDPADSYKTIRGFGPAHTILNCATATTSAIEINITTGSITAFEVVGLYIKQDSLYSAVHSTGYDADNRWDFTLRDSRVGGGVGGSSDAFIVYGTSVGAPSGEPSRLVLYNNLIEATIDLIAVGNHLSVYSYGNVIATRNVPAGVYSRCFWGVGSSYSDTVFLSVGDRCEIAATTPSCTNTTTSQAGGTASALEFTQGGFGEMRVIGMTAVLSTEPGTTCGPVAIKVLGVTGTQRLEVIGSTFVYSTADATQTAIGAYVSGIARLTLRNVRFLSSGLGNEYDLVLGSSSTSLAWLYVDRSVSYSSVFTSGSGVFAGLDPAVIRSRLRASDAIAVPATGAPIDANGEYRLFDAASAENSSWRNERVSDGYIRGRTAPKFRVFWKPITATSGAVRWRVGACSAAEDDAFPCTASSFGAITDTVTGGAAGDLYITDWTDFPAGLFAASRGLVVTAQRDAADAADTMAGDAALIAVEISYEVR